MARRVVFTVVCAVAGLGHAGVARAYFGTGGSGAGSATTGQLGSPGTATATVSGSKVIVTWSAAVTEDGTPADSYDIERYDGSGNDLGDASCGSVPAGAGSPNAGGTFTCADYPGPGNYQYVVTADVGQSWSTAGGSSNVVTVTAGTALTMTAPTSSVTATAITPGSLQSTLSGATASAGGTVTFTVFGPQTAAPKTCTSGGTAVGTATVSGAGTYQPSAAFTPSTSGTYWWYASYGGDQFNAPAASRCGSKMASTVVKYAPSNTVAVPASATAGIPITKASITSTLSAAGSSANGRLTFTVFGPQASAPTTCTSGGTTVGTATPAGNGTYSPSAGFTPTQAGTYWWYVGFAGDTGDSPANSGCGAGMASTTVAVASPTLTATASSSGKTGATIAAGSISSVLAASSGTSATGTVTFTVFGPQASAPTTCTSGGTTVGTATVTGNTTYHPNAGWTPSTAGNYWWYASYGGDANNNPATSPCGSTMKETTISNYQPTVTMVPPNSDTAGAAIAPGSLSATISGAGASAGGTLTFTVFGPQSSAPSPCTTGGTTVGTATVNGPGTYNPSAGFTPTSPGDYWFYASYGGDANDNAANSSCGATATEMTVWKATAVALNSATSGSSVTSGGFTVTPSTTYLLLVSRTSGASDSVSSIASTGLSPTPTFTAISSQGYNASDYQWAYRFASSSSASGTASVTVNFADPLTAGEASFVTLVALAGNSASTPVVTANVAAGNGVSTTASASLPSAPSAAQDAMIVLLSGDGSLGSSPPTATGLTPVPTTGGTPAFVSAPMGGLAAYAGIPAQQSSVFSPFASQGWGTLAFELKHG